MHRSNWWNRKCKWTTPVKINLITDEQIRFRIWQKKQDNYANDLVKTQVFASFHMRADDTRKKVLPKLFLIIELCVDTSSWCLSKKNQYSRGVGRYSTKIYTGQEPCTGRPRPEVTPPYLFIYHFYQKWHPFHIPSLELCLPFWLLSIYFLKNINKIQNQNDFLNISQPCERN